MPDTVGQVLDRVTDLLAEVYSPGGVMIWLQARNRNLGLQRPIELILSGAGDQVLAEAERLVGGSYA